MGNKKISNEGCSRQCCFITVTYIFVSHAFKVFCSILYRAAGLSYILLNNFFVYYRIIMKMK